MDINTIINIAQIVVWVILGGLSLYFRTNSRLKEVAGDYISEAESVYKDTVKAGGMKHEYVVEKLYAFVPVYMRPIFTVEMISQIVDRAFESIESYGKQELDKAVDKLLPKQEEGNK